ncbi:MAG: 16S rRNA (cytidine(1402)-2'-O)-methyltransferase [Eubacteriales bacterium]
MNEEKNKIERCTLYLVATPIGNLSDLSPRAAKILAGVDFIAAEDTRVTAKLLAYIDTAKPMISYREHNIRECGEMIAARLAEGESCALVTDAGTPAISDPGEDIARLCVARNINVTAVPGPCAAICALTLSGLDARRFVFEGFIEGTKTKRTDYLELLKSEKRTIVFYEAPHNIKTTLSELYEVFGNRKIALCRELTKLNEEIIRTDISSAIALYNEKSPRGEYVLVVEGSSDAEVFWSKMSVKEHVNFYIEAGMTKMDAAKAVAKDRGTAKNIIYKELLNTEERL